MALQETLGEALARFEHGRGARGTKDAQAALAERVDDAEGERQLGTDDGEVGLLGFGQADHGVEVFEIDGNAAGHLGHAAVARRANDLRDARAARDRPGQRMLAASRTKDQDFHCSPPFLGTRRSPKSYGRQWGRGKSNGVNWFRRSTGADTRFRTFIPLYDGIL